MAFPWDSSCYYTPHLPQYRSKCEEMLQVIFPLLPVFSKEASPANSVVIGELLKASCPQMMCGPARRPLCPTYMLVWRYPLTEKTVLS